VSSRSQKIVDSSSARPKHGKRAVRRAAHQFVELLESRTLLTSVISPVADTFVRDHDFALTNFGASPLLIVKQAQTGDTRVTFLKFDLSGITTVGNAVLQLTGKLGNQLASPVNTGVFGVSDSSWVEGDGSIVNLNGDGFDTDNSPGGEMTWNNQPAVSTGALATVNVNRDTYQTYQWDVSSYLQGQINAGNTQVTLAVEDLAPALVITQFLSREATGPGSGPELIISGDSSAPPSAVISAPDITSPSSGESISVAYTSPAGVDTSTIDPSDLQVNGPNGALPVTGVQVSGSGSTVTATYSVSAPSGTWGPNDNGAYTVQLGPSAVQDLSGASILPTLGSFRVTVGDTTPPTAVISAPDVTSGGAASYSFSITYTDNVAVDPLSINTDNVSVSGPNGPLSITAVSVSSGTPSGTIVATYTVQAPGGSFDASDNGTYTVALHSDQVLDTAGNPAPATNGSFTVAISVPDTIAPTAQISAPNVSSPGGTSEAVTVVYSDNVAVQAASIDPSDISVVGPGGVTLNVSGVSINPVSDSGTITATYIVAAPGGSWSAANNGTYVITLNAGAVADTSGNGVGSISGSFNVAASVADNSPPTARLSAPTISTSGATTQTVTVVYSDNLAVNASTITADDISVSGPSGPLTVTGVSFNPKSSAGTITATYTVTAPNGSWDATDDGAYTIALNANQVLDTSGNAAAITFGSFAVNIPLPNPTDATFAGGNAVSAPFNVEAVATQTSDGRIIVVGYQGSANNQTQAVIERLNPDGSLDTSFGNKGQVVTPASTNDAWYGVAMQGTNHFVVVGTHNGDFSLARFDLNGNLDPTFGDRGVTFTDFGASTDVAYAVAVTTSSIVAVGSSNNSFAFARYTANGILDTTFGEGGRQVFDTGATTQALGAVVVQSNGAVVAAGSSGTQLAVVRLTANGDPDTTFGGDGLVSVSGLAARTDTGIPDFTEALALQTDGKLVVANRTTDGHFGVARLSTDGSLDKSFGNSGIATANFGGDDDVDSIVLQDTGDILVIGTSSQGGNALTAVAAFNSKGQLNSSFGNGGKITFASGVSTTSRELHIGDLVLRAFGGSTSGGKLLVGASSQSVVTTTSSIRRLIVPGSKGTPSIQQVLLGVFGIVNGKKNRLVIHDSDGTAITLTMTGGTGQAMQQGTSIVLNITASGTGAVLTITSDKGGDGRATFGDIVVSGNLKRIVAKTSDITGTLSVTGSLGSAVLGNIPGNVSVSGAIGNLSAGDLGGTLYSGASIGNLKLGNVTGVIAAAGNIKNIRATTLNKSKVLAGANLGSDGLLGGSGSAQDTFAAASIGNIVVSGAITGAFIGAGVDPVDAVYGNANDKSAGAASLIKSVHAKSADNSTLIESSSIKVVSLPKKVLATDPRIKILSST